MLKVTSSIYREKREKCNDWPKVTQLETEPDPETKPTPLKIKNLGFIIYLSLN